MKRLIAILLALSMILCFTACGAKSAGTEDPTSTEEPTTETWKTKSASLEFKDYQKLVFFQNYIVLNKDVAEDGKVCFPDFGDAMSPTEMTIAGETVKAYPLDRLSKIWSEEPTGTLTIIDNDGKTYSMPAEELANAYVGEFEIEVDGLLANIGVLKAGSLEVKGVKYIIAESKDAFMFPTTGEVAADEPISLLDVFKDIGWDENLVYRFVCFDNFWNYIDSQSKDDEDGGKVLAGTELRATLSGALNISIPFENRGGSGKMNDIFFVSITEQVK